MPARGLGSRYQGMKWMRGSTRWAIYWRDRCPFSDSFRCLWCNQQVWVSGDPKCRRRVCLDHLVPVSAGGTNHYTNVITACVPCNNRRRACSFYDWLDSSNVDELAARRILRAVNTPLTRELRFTGRLLFEARPRYGRRQPPPHWTDPPRVVHGGAPDPTNGAPDVPW